jgi:hypothetical protein
LTERGVSTLRRLDAILADAFVFFDALVPLAPTVAVVAITALQTAAHNAGIPGEVRLDRKLAAILAALRASTAHKRFGAIGTLVARGSKVVQSFSLHEPSKSALMVLIGRRDGEHVLSLRCSRGRVVPVPPTIPSQPLLQASHSRIFHWVDQNPYFALFPLLDRLDGRQGDTQQQAGMIGTGGTNAGVEVVAVVVL